MTMSTTVPIAITTEQLAEAAERHDAPPEDVAIEPKPTGEPKGGRYRHIEASRWAVHHLLRYHYLSYWPINVDRVFATIDITTGTIVAACVFAYPVLRCELREQVFGKLSPETLNRDFRQLVRWMVHPDHRNAKVGHNLLKWSLSKMTQPVVEAINRSWVPTEGFKEVGMIERGDGKRHYYYRLKNVRSRVDEVSNPPAQEPPPTVVNDATHPRVWTLRLQHPDASLIAYTQHYAGARIVAHRVTKETYTAEILSDETPDTLAKYEKLIEVKGDKRDAVLRGLRLCQVPEPAANN